MSVEHVVICDDCGRIVEAASTMEQLRARVRLLSTVEQRGRKHICMDCQNREGK